MLPLIALIITAGCTATTPPIKLVSTPCADRQKLPSDLVSPPVSDDFLEKTEKINVVFNEIINDYLEAQKVVNQYNACRATLKILGDVVE